MAITQAILNVQRLTFIFIGPACVFRDLTEFKFALYFLFIPISFVDKCHLVGGESVPLHILEPEEAGAKDDGKKHVENPGWCEGLSGKCCRVTSILKTGHVTLKPYFLFQGCTLGPWLTSISLLSQAPHSSQKYRKVIPTCGLG